VLGHADTLEVRDREDVAEGLKEEDGELLELRVCEGSTVADKDDLGELDTDGDEVTSRGEELREGYTVKEVGSVRVGTGEGVTVSLTEWDKELEGDTEPEESLEGLPEEEVQRETLLVTEGDRVREGEVESEREVVEVELEEAEPKEVGVMGEGVTEMLGDTEVEEVEENEGITLPLIEIERFEVTVTLRVREGELD